MKVGILTVPFNNNYGGFLQAFALKSVLGNMGHEVVFINRRRNKPHRAFLKKIVGWPYFLYIDHRRHKKIKQISFYSNQFVKNYLSPLTKEFYTSKSLEKCNEIGFDAIVVGSDQVWRYLYNKSSIEDFFLAFLKSSKVRRISYSASFGTSVFEYSKEKVVLCSSLLKQFHAISVREESAKIILENHFQIPQDKVSVVLDPTLLLPVEVYKNLLDPYKSKDIEPGYLFSYILDENPSIFTLITKVSRLYNFRVLRMNAQTGDLNRIKVIKPVEEWLCDLFYADFVITDSFHGCVFSILFNKQFVVVGNKKRGNARFETLLKTFRLQSRFVDTIDDSTFKVVSEPIDWSEVNNILKIKRQEGISFLKESIS